MPSSNTSQQVFSCLLVKSYFSFPGHGSIFLCDLSVEDDWGWNVGRDGKVFPPHRMRDGSLVVLRRRRRVTKQEEGVKYANI
jgi:hypothetical protein